MSLKLGTTDISGVPTTLINNVNNKADASTVVNTRFDGQWVSSNAVLSTATAKGTYTINLSSYLPNDSYNYEVLINAIIYREGSSSSRLYILDLVSQQSSGNAYRAGASANAVSSYNRFSIVVGSNKTFQAVIADNNASSSSIGMLGYRRIGTNS